MKNNNNKNIKKNSKLKYYIIEDLKTRLYFANKLWLHRPAAAATSNANKVRRK